MNEVSKGTLNNYKKLFGFKNEGDFIRKGNAFGGDRFKAVYLFTVTENGTEHPVYVGMSSRFYGRIRDYTRQLQIQAINDIKIRMEIKWLQDKAEHFSVYYWQVDVETTRNQLHDLENKEIQRIDPYFNRREKLTEEEQEKCNSIDKQVLKLFAKKQEIKSTAKLRKT